MQTENVKECPVKAQLSLTEHLDAHHPDVELELPLLLQQNCVGAVLGWLPQQSRLCSGAEEICQHGLVRVPLGNCNLHLLQLRCSVQLPLPVQLGNPAAQGDEDPLSCDQGSTA